MGKVFSFLEGKRTYLIMAANALSAVALYLGHEITLAVFIQTLFFSAGGSTLRMAVK